MTASVSSVDICVHATGAYTAYAQSLARSLDRFAFPGSRVRMIVFTDSPASFNEISSNLQRIELLTVDAPARSWPDATIKRFGDYARNRAVFRADLLMFLDADMLAVSEFGPELTPHRWPTGVALVLHPGFFEREQAGFVSRLLRRRGEQSPAPKGAWEPVHAPLPTLSLSGDDFTCAGAPGWDSPIEHSDYVRNSATESNVMRKMESWPCGTTSPI